MMRFAPPRRTVKECAHCGQVFDSAHRPRVGQCPMTGHTHELKTVFVDIDYTEGR